MTTGENIKRIRKQKKISQKELAQKSGVSIATIQGYEQGKYNSPKLETLEKIANALQVDIKDIDGRGKYVVTVFHPSNMAKGVKKNEETGVFVTDYAPDSEMLDLIQKRNHGDELTSEEFEQLAAYDDMRQRENEKAVNTFRHAQILTAFDKLNEEGKDRTIEYAELLAGDSRYRKEED